MYTLHELRGLRIASGLTWWSSGKESACQCRGHGFDPRSGIDQAILVVGRDRGASEPMHHHYRATL